MQVIAIAFSKVANHYHQELLRSTPTYLPSLRMAQHVLLGIQFRALRGSAVARGTSTLAGIRTGALVNGAM